MTSIDTKHCDDCRRDGDFKGEWYCVDPTCPCHSIDTKGWAERFDEKFFQRHDNVLSCRAHNASVTPPEIKNFISSLLSTDRTKLAERVRKMRDVISNDYDEGYEEAIDDVLAIINEPTDHEGSLL